MEFQFGPSRNPIESSPYLEGCLLGAVIVPDVGKASLGIPPHDRLEVQLGSQVVVVRLIDPHVGETLKTLAGCEYMGNVRVTASLFSDGRPSIVFERKTRTSCQSSIPEELAPLTEEIIISKAHDIANSI